MFETIEIVADIQPILNLILKIETKLNDQTDLMSDISDYMLKNVDNEGETVEKTTSPATISEKERIRYPAKNIQMMQLEVKKTSLKIKTNKKRPISDRLVNKYIQNAVSLALSYLDSA